jgi:hypothetical protein
LALARYFGDMSAKTGTSGAREQRLAVYLDRLGVIDHLKT